MGLVNFVFSSITTCAEVVCILLDLNFIIVHSLIRFVVACVSFVNNLPTLLVNSLVKCWNFALFSLVSLAESAAAGAQGTASQLGGLLESLKMVGHLSSHLWLRGREQIHRGAASVCDGCGIALSLVVYLVNSLVNMLLIGAQNLYGAVVSLWQAVSSPLQMLLELVLTVLTCLHSGLVGTSLVLWTPCSLALDGLLSLGRLLLGVFVLNAYGRALAVTVALAAALYFNPEPTRRYAHYIRSVPALRRLRASLRLLLTRLSACRGRVRRLASAYGGRTRAALHRLQETLWVLLDRLLLAACWHLLNRLQLEWRLQRPTLQRLFRLRRDLESRLRLRLGLRPGLWDDDDERVGGDGEGADDGEDQRAPPDGRAGARRPPLVARRQLQRRAEQPEAAEPAVPSSSTERPLRKHSGAGASDETDPGCAGGLLSLLKEQEDRKRCVICQDSLKTVVLLPCRHLCLCLDCTGMLLRQPIYLQNCPLCRHMIISTLNVYL